MSRLLPLILLLPAYALAAPLISNAPESVEVTIYRDSNHQNEYGQDGSGDSLNGLAMITETRSLELPAGASHIEFRSVADSIVPQTAKLESLPGQIIESNFDYNVLAPGNLLAHSIGKSVRLVRTDFRSGKLTEQTAILRSAPNGVVVEVDGKIEPLNCGGLIERLIFDDNTTLVAKPTLSVNVTVRPTGRYTLRLSYLAVGMNWSADYVATIRPDSKSLDLTAWITLANRLNTSFANAPVHVVAGSLSRVEGATVAPVINVPTLASRCWPVGSFASFPLLSPPSPKFDLGGMMMRRTLSAEADKTQEAVVTGHRLMAKVSNLGDYKLYSLPEPTTVAAQQSKQVRFLDQREVRFDRVYLYKVDGLALDANQSNNTPTVTLRLENKQQEGLGKPLPSGTVSVMQSADNSAVLAGQHRIDDIPVDSPVELEIGRAMDVRLQSRVVSETRISNDKEHGSRRQIEVQLANNKSVAVKLEVQHIPNSQAWRVVGEPKRHVIKSGRPQWAYTLKPGERAVLAYTIEELY
jgi:hypothetical protein